MLFLIEFQPIAVAGKKSDKIEEPTDGEPMDATANGAASQE